MKHQVIFILKSKNLFEFNTYLEFTPNKFREKILYEPYNNYGMLVEFEKAGKCHTA